MLRTTCVALVLIVALLVIASPRVGATDLLANGGFEDGAAGWLTNAGHLDTVSSPVHAGALSGRFSGSGQPTTQFAYQWIDVRPDEHYEASGWVAATGAEFTRVYLRVSWFDFRGQLITQSDSAWLPQLDGTFHYLSAGTLLSPSATRSARISVVVQSESWFIAHLDNFDLSGPAPLPITATPEPTGKATMPPTISPTIATVTPRPVPTRTPKPAPSRTPVATSATAPTSSPDEPNEPLVFPELVNGSFEEVRSDETPFGWRKQGGEITSVGEPRTNGSRSLALQSQTSSTKWAYQTVIVAAGGHYRASVDAYAAEGTEAAFLRVSWYENADGGGPALSSVDSVESSTPADGAFRRLSTEPVLAPAGAASAKIRLMLRPQSDQPAVAYFDAVGFSPAEPGAEEVVFGPDRGRSGNVGAQAGGGSADAPSVEPSGPAPRTPVRLANVKPIATEDAVGAPLRAGSGQENWAIALAVGVAATAIAIAGGHELWQRRKARASGDPSSED